MMDLFKELEFEDVGLGRKQARMEFDNNYGASIMTGAGTFSNKDKPYELAVLYCKSLCYTTNITSDVLGWLTEHEVNQVLNDIKQLKD